MAGRQMTSITVLIIDRITKLIGGVPGSLRAAALRLDFSLNPAEGLRLRCP